MPTSRRPLAAFTLALGAAIVAMTGLAGLVGPAAVPAAARSHKAPPAAVAPAPVAPAPAAPPTLEQAATRIRDAASADGGAWTKLAWLTDRIGPRLSGSPGAQAAIDWTLQELRRDGMTNVHGETVMVPHWVRGEEAVAITAPVARPVVAVAIGMSVPTPPEGITAEVVESDSLEGLAALGERVRGKIVLLSKATPAQADGGGYGANSGLRTRGPSEAARLGAVAVLVRSIGTLRARLPHTGSLRYLDGVPQIPAASIAEEDALRIHRFLDAGESVRVRIVLGCRTLPDVESANVVADLPGRERPGEIVLIGGHLDSWDLGDGAIDDGAGVVISMESLRLLRQLGLTPRRTIRAVLFMNEENGVHGGHAYADAHKDELDRHVAAIESDSGAGRPLGFNVFAGAGAADTVRALAERLVAAGSSAGSVEASDHTGVDIDPLRAAGVPLLGLRQDATRYFDWHHTMADTLDKIDPGELAENTAAMAFMAYALAESADPLPRSPAAAPKGR